MTPVPKKCIFISGAGVLFLLAAVLYHAGYKVFAFLPPCPYYRWSRLACPGCGGIRATYALFRMDLAQVIRWNLFLYPYLLLLGVFLLFPEFRKNRVFLLIVCILPFAFWIVRNLPWYPFPLENP